MEAGVSEAHSHERKGEDDISNRTELTGNFFPLSYEVSEAKDTHRFAER